MIAPEAGRRAWLSAAGGWLLSRSLGSLAADRPADSSRIRFVLIGDTPYGQGEVAGLTRVLAYAATGGDFYLHVGDIKSGLEPCTDELLARRIALLDTAPRPLVLIPGDNEWTDCSRFYLGNYDPIERLRHLRRLAYSRGGTLGRGSLPITAQVAVDAVPADEYALPEHQRWPAGPCLFVTLNLPGSANGLTAAMSDDTIRAHARAVERWLEAGAEEATRLGLKALVVVCHGQAMPPHYQAGDETVDVIDRTNPYAWFRSLLRRVVARFDGRVIHLHGDTHQYLVDHPWSATNSDAGATRDYGVDPALVRRRLDRFMRIRSFGSPMSTGWISIEIIRQGEDVRVVPTPHL